MEISRCPHPNAGTAQTPALPAVSPGRLNRLPLAPSHLGASCGESFLTYAARLPASASLGQAHALFVAHASPGATPPEELRPPMPPATHADIGHATLLRLLGHPALCFVLVVLFSEAQLVREEVYSMTTVHQAVRRKRLTGAADGDPLTMQQQRQLLAPGVAAAFLDGRGRRVSIVTAAFTDRVPGDGAPHFERLRYILGQLVNDTHVELPPAAWFMVLGEVDPQVLLFAERGHLVTYAQLCLLLRHFGITEWLVNAGHEYGMEGYAPWRSNVERVRRAGLGERAVACKVRLRRAVLEWILRVRAHNALADATDYAWELWWRRRPRGHTVMQPPRGYGGGPPPPLNNMTAPGPQYKAAIATLGKGTHVLVNTVVWQRPAVAR